MISIRIDAEEAGRALTVLGANLGNLADPITKLLDLGLEDGRANLESRGVMFNEGWAIMSPWTTKVAKALYGKDREPLDVLEDTGALLLSLVKDAPFNIFEVGDGEGEAGSGYLSTRTGFGVAVGPAVIAGPSCVTANVTGVPVTDVAEPFPITTVYDPAVVVGTLEIE